MLKGCYQKPLLMGDCSFIAIKVIFVKQNNPKIKHKYYLILISFSPYFN